MSVFSRAIQRLFEFLCYMSSHVDTNILLVFGDDDTCTGKFCLSVFGDVHKGGCFGH
jgi:hypothetical protein